MDRIDIILVCRKQPLATLTNPQREQGTALPIPVADALKSARTEIARLRSTGFALSRNDRKPEQLQRADANRRRANRAGHLQIDHLVRARRGQRLGEIGAVEV